MRNQCLLDKVKLLKTNDVYRVGDVVGQFGPRWQRDRNTILTDPKYRGTILFDYLNSMTKEGDFDTLRRIINDHTKKYLTPRSTDLVVHLRLGDVFGEERWCPGYDALRDLYSNFYDLFELDSSITRVVFVTAMHYGADDVRNAYCYNEDTKAKSELFLNHMIEQTRHLGLDIDIVSNENVDQDICYMANSKWFVRSISRFAEFIGFCLSEGSKCIFPFEAIMNHTNTDYWKGKMNKRLNKNVYGITCFFNPNHYRTKIDNYHKFRKSTKYQGLQLCAVELAFDDCDYELTKDDAEILVQVRGNSNNILWQTQRLFNIAMGNLPDDCDKILWIDCDLIFEDDDWVQKVDAALDQYKIVRPFSWAVRLPPGQTKATGNEPLGNKTGERYIISTALHLYPDKYDLPMDYAHTGLAWAAQRSVFEELPFYEYMILGGYDGIINYAIHDQVSPSLKVFPSESELFKDMMVWSDKIKTIVDGSISFIEGDLYHLWHGEPKYRKYNERYHILITHDFKPSDLFVNSEGLLEWVKPDEPIVELVASYFEYRNEDGVQEAQNSVFNDLNYHSIAVVMFIESVNIEDVIECVKQFIHKNYITTYLFHFFGYDLESHHRDVLNEVLRNTNHTTYFGELPNKDHFDAAKNQIHMYLTEHDQAIHLMLTDEMLLDLNQLRKG